MSIEWHCLVRGDIGRVPERLSSVLVVEHPLRPMTVTALADNAQHQRTTSARAPVVDRTGHSNGSGPAPPVGGQSVQHGCDPLSLFAQQQQTDNECDPLTKLSEEYHASNTPNVIQPPVASVDTASTALWQSKRSHILKRYTTSDRLTLVSSFLSGGEMPSNQPPATLLSDQVRHRLEQLDECDAAGSVAVDLTQQDYVQRIEQLNGELARAWAADQRVRSLKIAIQCAKLLADTSVMQFYPSQFVLITDILDNFGRLVYERLRSKATPADAAEPLPDDFAAEQVSPAARETCENWFYKIASVRELLPRFYMEIAILRCYTFLVSDPYGVVLRRLTQIARGIGDPLIAAYARCYLCRTGMAVCADRSFVLDNMNDFLFVYHTMFSGAIRAEFARQRLDIDGYVALYQPALDWIMLALAAHSPSGLMLDTVTKMCQDKKNNGILLHSILGAFAPDAIASHAQRLVSVIANSTTEGIGRPTLLRTLGERLVRCAPPVDQLDTVYSGAWSVFVTLTDRSEFVRCIVPWSLYAVRHCSAGALDALLRELCTRLTSAGTGERHCAELQSIAEHLFANVRDLDGLLAGEHLLQFVDLFAKDGGVRQDVCKLLLTELRRRHDGERPIADPVVIHALMHVCQQLSDTVTELTVDDERRQIAQLIGAFVRRATYGRDFEQQLSFYVDARSAFAGLDEVFVVLVHCVNRLSMRALQLQRRPGEASAFARACAAYCYITVPSIASVSSRLDLYLLSGQVALQNACLGQADACFETALQLLDDDGPPDVADEPHLAGYLCAFLGTLLVVPDSPARETLHLLRRLLRCADRYSWQSAANASAVYLATLDLLGAAARERYAYGIAGVVSNDRLYAGAPKFIAELDAIGTLVVGQLLGRLKALAEREQPKAQAALALDMFERVVWTADLGRHAHLVALALNLWTLAMKNRALLDSNAAGRVLQRFDGLVARMEPNHRRQALEVLAVKMKQRM